MRIKKSEQYAVQENVPSFFVVDELRDDCPEAYRHWTEQHCSEPDQEIVHEFLVAGAH